MKQYKSKIKPNMPVVALIVLCMISICLAGCAGQARANNAAEETPLIQIAKIDRYYSGDYVAVIESFEAWRVMNSESGAVMLDVRSERDYAIRHISIAANAPLDVIAEYAVENIPEKDRIIIFYCFCGNSGSSLAVPAYNALTELGYTNVYYTEPGSEWEYEGTLPLDATMDSDGRFLISGEAAKERFDADNDVILLDVRNQDEYDREHIEGSVLIPVSELPSRLDELPDKNAVIIVYCGVGIRSAAAYDILVENGYTNVFNMQSVNLWPEELSGDSFCAPCNE